MYVTWHLKEDVRSQLLFVDQDRPRPVRLGGERLRVVRDLAIQHIFGRPAGTSPGASLACLESANQHFHA